MANLDKEIKIIMLKGEAGSTITSIEKTATSGKVDTYTVTTNNGETYTFNVTNGIGISSITKTDTSGKVDTYTITLTDGTTTTFTVTNGEVTQAQLDNALLTKADKNSEATEQDGTVKKGYIINENGIIRVKTTSDQDDDGYYYLNEMVFKSTLGKTYINNTLYKDNGKTVDESWVNIEFSPDSVILKRKEINKAERTYNLVQLLEQIIKNQTNITNLQKTKKYVHVINLVSGIDSYNVTFTLLSSSNLEPNNIADLITLLKTIPEYKNVPIFQASGYYTAGLNVKTQMIGRIGLTVNSDSNFAIKLYNMEGEVLRSSNSDSNPNVVELYQYSV